jgi:hypothetical protein
METATKTETKSIKLQEVVKETEKAMNLKVFAYHPGSGKKMDWFLWLPKSLATINEQGIAYRDKDDEVWYQMTVDVPEWMFNKKVAEVAKKLRALPQESIFEG